MAGAGRDDSYVAGLKANSASFDAAAEAAEDWGVGRALPQDADADTMRTAIEEVLNKGSYRKNAAWFSQEIAESNGAARASDEIETLLPKGARKAS